MAKRMGRPPKPATERKSTVLRIRLTAAEYRRLERKARKQGLTVSEYARLRLEG